MSTAGATVTPSVFLKRVARKDTNMIYGTWDFKWPRNHVVTIAFQQLYGERSLTLINAAIEGFKKAIAAWRPDTSEIALKWEFKTDRLLPSPRTFDEAGSLIGEGHEPIDYDVLVSFAALPTRIPRSEMKTREQTVKTQTSELGSYALRVDYGVPTLFLGPDQPAVTLKDWIGSPDFTAAAVHEFGHTLGIAHTHQNPLYWQSPPSLKSLGEVKAILRAIPRFANFPDDEIEQEIYNVWPHLAVGDKTVQFSDWIQPPKDGPLEQQSCMAHPGWSLFLVGAGPCDGVKELQAPTAFDLEQLAAMYPPR